MSKLEQLINELCPEGVEYIRLKECTEMKRGTSATKKTLSEGQIPVISGGKEPAFYCDTANRYGETITIAGSGAGAGYVQYWNEPIFVNDAFSIKGSKNLNTRYLYHYLLNIQEKIYDTKKRGGVPHVHISSIENFLVPTPPLPVQEEIVRILDKFTELTTELTTRKQQYEYYREQLFIFGDEVEWKSLKELLQPKGYIRGPFGSALKKDFFVNEGVPIYEQQHAIYNKRDFRYYIDNNRAEKLKRFMVKPYDLIISCSGTIGKISIITPQDRKGIINQALLILRLDLTKVKITYIKYYLECFTNLIVTSSGGAITNIEKREIIEKIKIPVPPLEEQQRLVDILDRFDKLCNDISDGLPAEIEARQKQYEYYRDKLLTFKKKEATENE